MNSTLVLAARRSAIVPRNGAFAALPFEALASPVLEAVMQDAGINARDVDELVVSNALGSGGNPARIIALASGLPERVAGLSLDRQCAGGLDALLLADALIRSGQCDLVIAGGCEKLFQKASPLSYICGRAGTGTI